MKRQKIINSDASDLMTCMLSVSRSTLRLLLNSLIPNADITQTLEVARNQGLIARESHASKWQTLLPDQILLRVIEFLPDQQRITKMERVCRHWSFVDKEIGWKSWIPTEKFLSKLNHHTYWQRMFYRLVNATYLDLSGVKHPTFHFGYVAHLKHVQHLEIPDGLMTEADFARLSKQFACTLKHLSFHQSHTSTVHESVNKMIASSHLGQLTQLRHLRVPFSFTDAELTVLGKLTCLTSLNLSGCITITGATLSGLPSTITYLNLENTNVLQPFLRNIGERFPRLIYFNVQHLDNFDERALSVIAQFPAMKNKVLQELLVDIECKDVDDNGQPQPPLTGYAALKSLTLSIYHGTDAYLQALTSSDISRCTVVLELQPGTITDKGVQHLSSWPKLQRVIMVDCDITDIALMFLRHCTSVELNQCHEVLGTSLCFLSPQLESLVINGMNQIQTNKFVDVATHIPKLETLKILRREFADEQEKDELIARIESVNSNVSVTITPP